MVCPKCGAKIIHVDNESEDVRKLPPAVRKCVHALQRKGMSKIRAIKICQSKFAVMENDYLCGCGDYEIVDNGDEVDIIIMGDIGDEVDGNEIAQLISELNKSGVKVINERINSGGGRVINGLSIVSANLNSEAEIRTFNEGICASMAGIILMTGDKIFMNDYATLMIHEPSIHGDTIETTGDEREKKQLIAIRDSLSKIIQNRTGKTKNQVDKIMNEEVWYNAKDAKKEKFIDKIIITKNTKNEAFTHKIRESYLRKVGNTWEVVIIESGLSNNGFYYTDEVLESYKTIFEGISVYAHSFGNYYTKDLAHRPKKFENPEKLILNKVGWIKNVNFKRENRQGYLVGILHSVNSALSDVLNNTWEQDRSKMPELSVDIDGDGYKSNGMKIVTKIYKVRSVDLVDQASAGGRFLRLVAGTTIKEEKMNKFLEKLLALVKEGKLKLEADITDKSDEDITAAIKLELDIKDEAKVSDEQTAELVKYPTIAEIKDAMQEMINKPEPKVEPKPEPKPEPKVEPKTEPQANVADKLEDRVAALAKKLEEQEAKVMLNAEIAKDKVLPEQSKRRISESFSGVFTRKDVQAAIKAEKVYLESLSESGRISIKEGVSLVAVTDTPVDRKQRALDMLVDPDLAKEDEYKGTPEFSGIREAFESFVGMNIKEARNAPWNIKEATTASFPVALGTSMNKKAIRLYKYFKIRAQWTKFVTEEIVTNTNQQTLFRFGEFDDLSTVAEGGNYTALTAPTEDNPTYTPIKKGNTFVLTEEMLINDNLRAMRQWPKKMAQAAIRTLSKYVMNRVTGCDGSSTLNSLAIYDGGVLYSNVHGNLTANTLSAANLGTGVTAMNEFSDTDSAEPLFIEPKYLVTVPQNRATAWNVTKNELVQANASGGSIQNVYSNEYKIEPIIMPTAYFCGSTKAWFLIAAPEDVEGLVVGYVNKKEPEILLQDNPTVATVFTNDQIKYKVKFRYGAAITDWRAFYGLPA
jgi:ATP-dependent protease ClpP protease subunit